MLILSPGKSRTLAMVLQAETTLHISGLKEIVTLGNSLICYSIKQGLFVHLEQDLESAVKGISGFLLLIPTKMLKKQ